LLHNNIFYHETTCLAILIKLINVLH
jgi:hypothetical protein